jgi:hypothetical protein
VPEKANEIAAVRRFSSWTHLQILAPTRINGLLTDFGRSSQQTIIGVCVLN